MEVKTQLSGAGAILVAAGALAVLWEGWHNKPYVDPVGILTVCAGHTGQDVKLSHFYSDQQCTDLFLKDLRIAHKAVLRCTPSVPAEMQPALVSFTFNVGEGAYCKSTLARRANAGDHVGACKELYKWVYAGGRKLPGLVKRRAAEAQSCLEGVIQ